MSTDLQNSFQDLLNRIRDKQDLTEHEAESAILDIMSGELSEEQIKDFLLGLREKGEALSEVVGAARAMRQKANPIEVDRSNAVDTCGTGGDGLHTFNISTLAALVVASCGVSVVKHGNRSITSQCGSADLLEALSLRIDLSVEQVQACLDKTGFCFMFAPTFHPAMKVVMPVRKALNVPTIFNLLGPLTNPAQVYYQIVGVANPEKRQLYIQALQALGLKKALVVRGEDGQDELSTTAPTEVLELNVDNTQNPVREYTVTPQSLGLEPALLEDLKGAGPEHNAKMALAVLEGERGPVEDAVRLSAAAALYTVGKAESLEEGLQISQQVLASGETLRLLQQLQSVTNE